MANSIQVDRLSAGYGSVRVLEGISLSVNDGETVTLLGANGNGKSTLMKCIMGIVRPSAGRITAVIEGVEHDLAGMAPEDIVDLGIVLVPEGRRLFARLTVEENLLLGAYRRTARSAIARNLAFCFETFPVLAERRAQLAGSMSGGEQQMLTVARTLMGNPRLVLLDEPSEGVAPLIVEQMAAMIVELKKQGLSVLLSEQNVPFAAAVCDRAYVLEKGQVRFAGTMAELHADEAVRRQYLTV